MMTDLMIRLRGHRTDRVDMDEHRRRVSFETDVSRFPLRMTAFLRDRLRRRWLRMKRN